jgi:hypothetical protein
MNAGGRASRKLGWQVRRCHGGTRYAVFKEGPASLRVDGQADKSGQAYQTLEFGAGKTYSVTGWVKTQGNAKVNFAVQSFAGDWSKNDFNQIGYRQGQLRLDTVLKAGAHSRLGGAFQCAADDRRRRQRLAR